MPLTHLYFPSLRAAEIKDQISLYFFFVTTQFFKVVVLGSLVTQLTLYPNTKIKRTKRVLAFSSFYLGYNVI